MSLSCTETSGVKRMELVESTIFANRTLGLWPPERNQRR